MDASERTRKCELAGIFYSCEYVHRAALATLQSASAPYLKALRPSCDFALFTAHTAPPSFPVTPPPPLSPFGSFPPFPPLEGCALHPGGGEEENELHRCPILRLLGEKKSV